MENWRLANEYQFAEGTVRYNIVGDGADVVLVHGTPWSSYTWNKMISALSDQFRFHFYDLVGYGQSEKRENQNVSLDVQGQLLAELIEHWNLERPKIVAHDFGGATSLRAHLLHNCDYDRLVLIDVVAMAPWGSPFFSHVRQHEKAFSGVPRYIHKAIVEAYIKSALGKDVEKDDFYNLMQPWLDDAGQEGFYRQIAQADQKYTDEVESQYAEIRCPVSVLWGDKDPWIPIETGRRLHQSIPGSRFIVVEGAGHLAQLEAPQFVNAQVADILS